jgi:hypothetical protein
MELTKLLTLTTLVERASLPSLKIIIITPAGSILGSLLSPELRKEALAKMAHESPGDYAVLEAIDIYKPLAENTEHVAEIALFSATLFPMPNMDITKPGIPFSMILVNPFEILAWYLPDWLGGD